MRKFLAACMAIVMIFTIAGCSSEGHEGEAKTPSGSRIQKGKDYQKVVDEFENSGFTNIKLKKLDDLVTGWLTKDGEVESVSVDGDTGYSADAWYPADVEVVITYHTFPEKESSESNDEPASTEEPAADILTVDNSPELAAMLSLKADMDQSYANFAEVHKNQVIEFDGCITYLTNHDDYDTRYDLLISAGDYVDENTANPGPIFKFKDVGVYDLGDGLTLANYIKVGSNVRIQAKVRSYNSDTGLFELDLISVKAR